MPNNTDQWRSYCEPLLPLGESLSTLLHDADDNQLRQEMYKHLYSVIAQAYFGLLYTDAQHPAFWPVLNSAFNTLAPNPDDSYYLCEIEGNGIYKITGERGSARLFSFTIGSGTFFTRGTGGFGPSLGHHNVDDLTLDDRGRFSVLLSQTKPADYNGDWWPLDPTASNIMARHRAYDWINERDGVVAIDRLDTPAAKPRPDAKTIDEKMQQIASWAKRNTQWSIDIVNKYREQGYINKLLLHGYADGGLVTQHYLDGLFDINADEAIIIETEIPDECAYWSFQLADEIYTSLDWINRQSNLNGYTARLDSDGKFRAVVSATDPGVPNWLDSAGYQRGIILGRWQDSSSAPVPELTKVKVSEVRKYLPANTPTISLEQRDAAIRLRRQGAQMRQKW